MTFRKFPFHRVNWITSSFLIGTFLISVTAVPWYIWAFWGEIQWGFQIALFVILFIVTASSITLGYHRLFSHLSFKASWPIRLVTLLFGSATFEGSALEWASDHRRHHKHVDQEEDPYDISKGFFYAHIGWLLFKMEVKPPFDNVSDLMKDKLVIWQHRYNVWIAILCSFGLPTLLGFWYGGPICALGAFLIGGVARVVVVQHVTFSINSLCHTVGRRPYSSEISARDSWIVALLTFGEGYHNFHHTFQHDYRNGVKPWQFDPTKWIVWTLNKVGLVTNVRRVPKEKIREAEQKERLRKMTA